MRADFCPFAKLNPLTRNFERSRGDGRPLMICDHITDGMGDPWGWWNRVCDPSEAASAHFVVFRTGTVQQYMPVGAKAWSNGPKNRSDMTNALVSQLVRLGENPNDWTVSIEHEGVPALPLTEPQVQASRRLHQWLAAEWGIPLDRTHVVGHYQFDDVTRHNCPGPLFPWDRILATEAPAVDPQTYPNGRRVPSAAEYDAEVWAHLQHAADALMNGGNGALGDDDDARTILTLKATNERRHGVTR